MNSYERDVIAQGVNYVSIYRDITVSGAVVWSIRGGSYDEGILTDCLGRFSSKKKAKRIAKERYPTMFEVK